MQVLQSDLSKILHQKIDNKLIVQLDIKFRTCAHKQTDLSTFLSQTFLNSFSSLFFFCNFSFFSFFLINFFLYI